MKKLNICKPAKDCEILFHNVTQSSGCGFRVWFFQIISWNTLSSCITSTPSSSLEPNTWDCSMQVCNFLHLPSVVAFTLLVTIRAFVPSLVDVWPASEAWPHPQKWWANHPPWQCLWLSECGLHRSILLQTYKPTMVKHSYIASYISVFCISINWWRLFTWIGVRSDI